MRFLLIALFLMPCLCFSQNIDTIYVVPENPTVNDEVKLVAHVVSSCPILYHDTVTILNDEILVNAKYYECGLTSIITAIDTFFIGNLKSGEYKLIFIDSLFSWGEFQFSDSDTIQINVSGWKSIKDYSGESKVEMFPNPFDELLNISMSSPSLGNNEHDNLLIKVYDLFGKEVLSKEIASSNFISLYSARNEGIVVDVAELEKGVYILDIGGYRQKIIKN